MWIRVSGRCPYTYVECIRNVIRYMCTFHICIRATPVYIVDIYRMCIYVETYVYVEIYVKRIHMSSVYICQNICRMYTYGVLCMLIRIMYVNTYYVCWYVLCMWIRIMYENTYHACEYVLCIWIRIMYVNTCYVS